MYRFIDSNDSAFPYLQAKNMFEDYRSKQYFIEGTTPFSDQLKGAIFHAVLSEQEFLGCL